MPKFTNEGLVQYAQYMLGYMSPYWFGTYGNIASEALYQEKKRQYKDQYEKWSKYSFESQYGMKVHDCIGLIKGYLMNPTIDENGIVQSPLTASVYNAKFDISANMLEQKAKEKGPISTIPEIPGLIVWKSGHVGIYVGNGLVIEERGHTYGTVATRLADRAWVKWLKHPDIQYIDEPTPEPKEDKCMVELTVLKKTKPTMTGVPVKRWQTLLRSQGYKGKDGKLVEVDSKFGGNSEYATINWQRDNGLKADGIVGTASWTKMIEG